MKTAYGIIFLLIGGIFASCTYVTSPNNVAPPAPSPASFDTTKRVAVVECWMGHTCIAPPHADSLLDSLEILYDSAFIAICIHDGFFAQAPPVALPPCATGHPTAFTEDFRCATSADYSVLFPSGPSSPVTGLVSRKNTGTNTEYKMPSTWQQHADTIVNSGAVASMHMSASYNSSTRAVDFTVYGTWLQIYSGTLNVAVMLTEDSLVGWQTDGLACDSQYVFNHVLRECMNTPGIITGTPLFTGTTAVGNTYSYTLPSSYTLPLTFNAAQCHLVALLYDVNTGDILQAWEEALL